MRLVPVLLALAATSAAADSATGYDHGKKIKLSITKVDGVAVGTKTAKAYRQMAKAAKKDGVALGIRSGFRTLAQQEALYNAWLAGKGNSAAPPGQSNHENGTALDLKLDDRDAYSWLLKHAAKYGFARTVPGEPWHWEYTGKVITAAAKAKPTKKRGGGDKKKSKPVADEPVF